MNATRTRHLNKPKTGQDAILKKETNAQAYQVFLIISDVAHYSLVKVPETCVLAADLRFCVMKEFLPLFLLLCTFYKLSAGTNTIISVSRNTMSSFRPAHSIVLDFQEVLLQIFHLKCRFFVLYL